MPCPTCRLVCLFLLFQPDFSHGQGEAEGERYRSLLAEIARHDELYFREAVPEISDAAYDELKRELAALVGRHPLLVSPSAGGDIGDDRTGLFPVRRHLTPMLSLRKVHSERDLRVFDERLRRSAGDAAIAYAVEPKYDGIALSLVYEDGRLVRAVTRGNGVEGDDVTVNARALLGVPVALKGDRPSPSLIELRAEAYATFARFEEANRVREDAGEPPFSHPRALAAGALRRIGGIADDRIALSFVIHGWGAWEDPATEPASNDGFADRMRDWGLPVAERLGAAGDAETLWELLQRIEPARRLWPMPTDGIVVKVNETALRRRLGNGADAPGWAFAFKYPAETVVTRVRAVTWQVGRTGIVTPVAELEPVKVGGVTVARATVHSPAHVERLGLRVGDEVEIERAGEVIPRILEVRMEGRSPDSDPLAIPSTCPSCGEALRDDLRAGQIHCPRRSCPAQVVRRLEHYVSPSAVNIPGFGPVLLENLANQGAVTSPADLYRISKDDLRRAGASGSADTLLAAVRESRRADPWRVIHGLGIPRVGAIGSRAVANETGGLPGLLDRAGSPGFRGEGALTSSVRASLEEYFSDDHNVSVVRQLVEAGVGTMNAAAREANPTGLDAEVVVFTGTLAGMTREQAAGRVLAAGGKVASAVSSRTTLVVAGEGAGEKLDEARRLRVRVVGEAEFRRILGDF